jgi:hypothetical protein
VSHLALSLSSKSGTPEDAMAMIEQLRRTVTDDAVAARLDEQLKLALLERDAQALERLAAQFESDRGRPITDLHELLRFGYARSLPPDPFGGTYTWDSAERRVRSSENPFRFTLRERSHEPEFHYRPDTAGRASQ